MMFSVTISLHKTTNCLGLSTEYKFFQKILCVLTIRYLSAIILRTIATFADVNLASLVFELERYDSYDILCHVHPGLQAYVIVQKLRVFSQSFYNLYDLRSVKKYSSELRGKLAIKK